MILYILLYIQSVALIKKAARSTSAAFLINGAFSFEIQGLKIKVSRNVFLLGHYNSVDDMDYSV